MAEVLGHQTSVPGCWGAAALTHDEHTMIILQVVNKNIFVYFTFISTHIYTHTRIPFEMEFLNKSGVRRDSRNSQICLYLGSMTCGEPKG